MSDLDRYQYGYDQNSNRLYKANVVGTSAVGYLDEGYTYDNLNRLTQMQRGNLSGGVITGTPTREMDYTLDPTGNWSAYLTKTNGTTDLNQTRSANKVNEITAIGGTPAWATPPVYDAAGNMTSFPQPATPASAFTATYDGWNRMVSINNSSGSVATYQYDGMGRRIVKTTTGTGGQTRHFYYTNNWQDIEERVGSSTTMDKQYVWGARYVDELVCRDDATPERLYVTQDANFNLTSISNTSGGVVERYYYDPYGNRTTMNASWGTIAASAYNWVIGHQGLMQDGESGLIYVRNRYLHILLGKWNQRDPDKYIDGLNLYLFAVSNPLTYFDPLGRDAASDKAQCIKDANRNNTIASDQCGFDFVNCTKTCGKPNNPSYSDCVKACQKTETDCEKTASDDHNTAVANCGNGIACTPNPCLSKGGNKCFDDNSKARQDCQNIYKEGLKQYNANVQVLAANLKQCLSDAGKDELKCLTKAGCLS